MHPGASNSVAQGSSRSPWYGYSAVPSAMDRPVNAWRIQICSATPLVLVNEGGVLHIEALVQRVVWIGSFSERFRYSHQGGGMYEQCLHRSAQKRRCNIHFKTANRTSYKVPAHR